MDVDDDRPKKLSTAKKIRIALAVTLALLAGASVVYTRYIVTKSALGGPCRYAFQCGKEAPQCMRGEEDGPGVCSRACDPPADCADGIRCVKVDLDERDDRGMPISGGYCFPQAFIDAKKNKGKADAGSGAKGDDAWLAAPQVPGQLEGEVTLRTDKGQTQGTPRSYVVMGSLIKDVSRGGPSRRVIVDTSSLRAFTIEDDKKTFAATVLASLPADIKVDKTGQKNVVLGKECELWHLDDGKSLRDACVVPGGAFVDSGSATVPAWQRDLAVRGVFALDVRERDKQGTELSHTSALKLDLHSVDPADMSIPKSYKNRAAR